MDVFFEILKFTLPSLIMLLGVWLVMHKMFGQEEARRNFEIRKQFRDVTLPVRLRAYERIILFLQRTEPESLLMRFDFSGMTVLQLQQMLHKAIRDEYEHNMSQQIYVSNEAWAMVSNARESLVQLINSCAAQLDSEAPAMSLAQTILNTYAASLDTPTEIAINYVKSEVRQLF